MYSAYLALERPCYVGRHRSGGQAVSYLARRLIVTANQLGYIRMANSLCGQDEVPAVCRRRGAECLCSSIEA